VIGYKVFAANSKNNSSSIDNSSSSGSNVYKLQTISLGGQNISYLFDPAQKVTTPSGIPAGIATYIFGKDLLHREMAMEVSHYSSLPNSDTKCSDDFSKVVFNVSILGKTEPVCDHHVNYADKQDLWVYFYKNSKFYKVQFMSGKTYTLDDNTVKTVAESFQ
jgi:hypothetical protein